MIFSIFSHLTHVMLLYFYSNVLSDQLDNLRPMSFFVSYSKLRNFVIHVYQFFGYLMLIAYVCFGN